MHMGWKYAAKPSRGGKTLLAADSIALKNKIPPSALIEAKNIVN